MLEVSSFFNFSGLGIFKCGPGWHGRLHFMLFSINLLHLQQHQNGIKPILKSLLYSLFSLNDPQKQS